MRILAIDTSTDYLSIAVTDGAKVRARFHKEAKAAHSRILVPTIEKVMECVKTRLKDLDCIALSIGPGSFTGLRIGVVTVKGLACTTGVPVVAVPTLDVIAYNALGHTGIIPPRKIEELGSCMGGAGFAPGARTQSTCKRESVICPVLDAHKKKVYAALYKSSGEKIRRISKYLLLPVEELMQKTRAAGADIFFLGNVSVVIASGTEFLRGASEAIPQSDAIDGRKQKGPSFLISHLRDAKCGIASSPTRVRLAPRNDEPPSASPVKIGDWHPRAEIVARLGAELLSKGKTVTPADLEPLYIYSKECDITGW